MEQQTNERKNGDWKAAYDYSLHLVTDRAWMSSDTLSSGVEQAILGGCTIVQLRETGIRDRDFYQLAMEIKEMTDRYEIPLIINNRIDIALASGAAGVHIGQKDLPLHAVRQSLGRDMCIGVSVTSVEEALEAENGGADYLGVGAMFPTRSKKDAALVSFKMLRAIRQTVHIPVVAIGGINRENAGRFREVGIDGIAAISGILAGPDIARAAREMKKAFLTGE